MRKILLANQSFNAAASPHVRSGIFSVRNQSYSQFFTHFVTYSKFGIAHVVCLFILPVIDKKVKFCRVRKKAQIQLKVDPNLTALKTLQDYRTHKSDETVQFEPL